MKYIVRKKGIAIRTIHSTLKLSLTLNSFMEFALD